MICYRLENMTLQTNAVDESVMYPNLLENELAKDCLIPMGITSENVANRFGITRQQQDFLGYLSQMKYVMTIVVIILV